MSNATATSITLGWTASTDNIGVTGYSAYRGSTAQGDSTVTTYTFTGLACGTTYLLAVEAFDSVGNRSARSSSSASTSACPDTSAPSAPSALTRSAATTTSITLSWTASSDNVGVTGYTAYRGTASQGNTTSTSYTFTGLACGTSYTLAVEAYDAVGNRSSRPSMSAVTAACPPVADTTPPSLPSNQQVSTTQTTILMTWGAATDNVAVAGYRAYRNGAVAGTTTNLSYTYSGLACGTTYTVALEAYDAAGNVSDKAFATGPATTQACPGDTQAPTTPGPLAATGSTQSSISLSWTASLDNVGVAGYTIYRGSTNAGTSTLPSYTLTGLACGTTYTIAVDAFDAAGNRSTRAQISAPTTACSAPPPPPPPAVQCADGQDNDADGKIDLADPGCSSASDTSESPDPPPPPPPPPPSGTSVAPGQSWQTAYNAAPALGVIRVLAGMHPDVTLTGSKQVTFLGDEGAFVRSLDLSAPVTVENVTSTRVRRTGR